MTDAVTHLSFISVFLETEIMDLIGCIQPGEGSSPMGLEYAYIEDVKCFILHISKGLK